jgi:alkanesulfonate monooxygenase SsuD/methylene tetrahydromethanopterin reductase-like flavin-dependent oxidoreductase (luciferase family)
VNVERFNGMVFERPLSKVREAVAAIKPVLSVPAERGPGGLRLERPVAQPVPIVLAALRGKMLGLAAEVADGAFTNFLPLSGLPRVLEALREGERAAGRPDGATELACRFFILPMPESDGLGLARQMFSAYASVPVYASFFRWLGWAEQIDPMVEAYLGGDRARAAELAPVELMREVFVFGSADEIRARIHQFLDGGITSAVLTPIAAPDQVPALIDALARS